MIYYGIAYIIGGVIWACINVWASRHVDPETFVDGYDTNKVKKLGADLGYILTMIFWPMHIVGSIVLVVYYYIKYRRG